jgi:predicted MFS family arabinose efflux permease
MSAKYYGNDPRIVIILSLSYSLWGLAFSSYSYLARYYAKLLGVSYITQAILEVFSNILSITILILIIVVINYIGKIKTITAINSLAMLSPLSVIISSFSKNIIDPHIGISIALIILSSSFITGVVARNLLIIDLGGKFIGRLIGIVMTANSMAMIIGPLLGYYIKEIYGYHVYFSAITLMFLLSSLLIFTLRVYYIENRDSTTHRSREKVFIDSLKKIFSINRGEKILYPFITFVILDRFVYNMWAQLLFALTAYENISSEIAAYFSTIQYMSWFLSQYLFGILTDKKDPFHILSLSEIFSGLAAISIGIGIEIRSSQLIFLSAILVGLSIASWIPSYNKIIQVFVSTDERPLFLSKLNIYAIIFGSPGPYVGGLIRDAMIHGLSHLFIASFIHFINAVLLISLMRRRVQNTIK